LRGYKVSPDGRHVVALTRAPQASNGAAI
jgi:hypothetical protein